MRRLIIVMITRRKSNHILCVFYHGDNALYVGHINLKVTQIMSQWLSRVDQQCNLGEHSWLKVRWTRLTWKVAIVWGGRDYVKGTSVELAWGGDDIGGVVPVRRGIYVSARDGTSEGISSYASEWRRWRTCRMSVAYMSTLEWPSSIVLEIVWEFV